MGSTKAVQGSPSLWIAVARQLRILHWVKNLLVFLPVIAAHHFTSASEWLASGVAFVAFSLLASSVYAMNDLWDVEADRKHPEKRLRPIASGMLPPMLAPLVSIILLATAMAVAATLHSNRLLTICLFYFGLNVAYTVWLKRLPGVDVVLLAVMYCLRILAGGAAANIHVSQWLLAFSAFFFFGLALAKRYVQLINREPGMLMSRGYAVADKSALFALGAASSSVSVLILVLYLGSPEAAKLYSQPGHLWPVVPVMLLWVSRYWLYLPRSGASDDPVVRAIKDPASWICVGLLGLTLMWAV